MAKARPIPDLSADESYAAAAAKILAVRAGELVEQGSGVLDVFEPRFPPKPYSRALKEVKFLADGLGERRDRDVAIGVLQDFSEKLNAPDRPGVESLIAELR